MLLAAHRKARAGKRPAAQAAPPLLGFVAQHAAALQASSATAQLAVLPAPRAEAWGSAGPFV